MKLLRFILVVLLSMAIPAGGFAAVPVCACPMQMQDEASATDADASSAMADCCKHGDSKSSPDKPCKSGQSCGVSGVFIALPAQFYFSAPVGRIILTHDRSPLLIGQAARIWHPPWLF
jgi:hypothetical protein